MINSNRLETKLKFVFFKKKKNQVSTQFGRYANLNLILKLF